MGDFRKITPWKIVLLFLALAVAAALLVLQSWFDDASFPADFIKSSCPIADARTGISLFSQISSPAMQLFGGVVAGLLTLVLLWNINLRKTVAKALREVERRNRDLQDSEARFKAFFDLAPYGCAVNDQLRRYRMVNQAFCRRIGMREEEVLGRTGAELGLITDEATYERIGEELRLTGEVSNREVIFSSHEGIRHGLYSSRLIEFGGEQLILSATVDITKRKRVEEALRESENSFTRLFDSAPIPLAFASEVDGYRATTWNESWYLAFGYAREEADGRNGIDIGLWLDPEERRRFLEKVQMQSYVSGLEVLLRRRDGAVRHCEVFGRFIGKTGHQVLMVAYLDITERKQAENAMRESESYNKVLFHDSHISLAVMDPQTSRFTDCNQAAVKMYGFTDRRELLEKTPKDVSTALQYDGRPSEEAAAEKIGQVLAQGSAVFEWSHQRPNGDLWDAEVHMMSFSHRDRKLIQLSLLDITGRKRAEAALKESEERFSKAFSSSPAPMVISDIETGSFIDFNENWLRMTGYLREELLGNTSYGLGVWQEPEDRKQLAFRLRQDGHIKDFPSQIVTASGKVRDVIWAAEIINIGGAEVMLSLVYDFTDKKRAAVEKEKLQLQLLQSQKMESVGRLAGGVAHDYNNMLGVILGHAELAMLKSDESDPLHEHLREIRNAAQRSAELTQQLLAFARRQTIAPKVLDLNESVTASLHMLRLIIGENIELVWLPGAEAYRVKIDPTQFNQLLMNLCINARDAIAGVGRISFETERVALDEAFCLANVFFTPGDYAVLTVSDNGCGMDKEIQSRIFEPFFTTKGIGQGTGLGLATIYGIVKQNAGYINVYSEPGRGTTFRIYLPRYADSAVEARETELGGVPRSNGETVLVVEDEAVLLDINTTMLVGLGYKVLAAGTPAEALQLAGTHAGRIDLLMTDVVMPEMNGRQLEQQVRRNNPGIRCLFMSGYTANVISHHGVLDEGVHFIQKPFSMQDVAIKVRETLDERPEDEGRNGNTVNATIFPDA